MRKVRARKAARPDRSANLRKAARASAADRRSKARRSRCRRTPRARAQRDQGAPAKAGQDDKAQPQRSGQGQRDQQSPAQAQSPQRQDNQRGGQAAQGEGSQGSKTLTTEQRTTIRNTVVSKGPRATNVNFSVSVGTTVPTSVRVVAVPSTLIEIYPEWRGHMYFVVNDEIIIVDSNHRIIAVLPV